MPAQAAFDHLVVAAATLEQGERYVESQLGVAPQRGGKHVAMGTHNSLLRLGAKAYLEVIAIDPHAAAPSRPRWFGLDALPFKRALAERPRLIHWVARTAELLAARAAFPTDPGEALSMARGVYRWQITVRADGHLPAGGVLPSLIQWADARHPADELPDHGLCLAELIVTHPQASLIAETVAALDLAATIRIAAAAQPTLAAVIQTERGPLAL